MIAIARRAPPGPLTRSTTLEALAPQFLRWFEFVRRRSENTIRAYEADLRVFLGFAREAELVRPEDVTFRHLEFYLGWLQTTRGAKPQTANRHLHALRAFWKWMRREEITTGNPAEDTFTLPTTKKLPDYLSIAEQEQVLDALAQLRTPMGKRDYALIATALFTGLRCSELCRLKLAHVNLAAGNLRVVDGKGHKDRELPIVPRLEAILREYLGTVRPALLSRPSGQLVRYPGSRNWHVRHYVGSPVDSSRATRTADRAEAERFLTPAPAALVGSPWVFVNANPRGGHRVGRAGQPLGTRAIFHLVRRVVKRILGRNVHPHSLRHSMASRARENRAPLELIGDALGHAQLSTTLIYAHISTTKRRDDLAKFLQ